MQLKAYQNTNREYVFEELTNLTFYTLSLNNPHQLYSEDETMDFKL